MNFWGVGSGKFPPRPLRGGIRHFLVTLLGEKKNPQMGNLKNCHLYQPTNQPHATTNTQHIIEARVAGIDQTNTRTSCGLPGSPAHHGQHIALHCAVATCGACTRRGSAISSADCLRSRTSCCCARSRSAGPTQRSGAGGRRAAWRRRTKR